MGAEAGMRAGKKFGFRVGREAGIKGGSDQSAEQFRNRKIISYFFCCKMLVHFASNTV